MKLINEININEIWSMEKLWGADRYLDSRLAMYHCAKCDTGFSIIHRPVGGSFYSRYNDSLVRCPICGNLEQAYTRNSRIGLQSSSVSNVPESMRLRLYECKYGYRLDVIGRCIRLDANDQRVLKPLVRESIKFDIPNRLTTWTRLVSGQKLLLELGNPFDNTFFENSVLVDLGANLNTRKELCTELASFLKMLRDVIRNKFKTVHGYDIGSLFTGVGRRSYYGKVAVPVSYIATRLIFPDLKDFTKGNTVQDLVPLFGDLEEIFSNTDIPRKAQDSLSGLLELYGLPDKKAYRKILKDNPFKGLLLRACNDACGKPDIAVRVYHHYAGLLLNYSGERAIKLLSKGLPYWESKGRKKEDVVRYLCSVSVDIAYDTYEMDYELAAEFRGGIDKIGLAKLHDALVKRRLLMDSSDYDLQVPEAIKRRLEMQKERLKFFLPSTSYALKAIGSDMHNCVGTYAKKVLQGQCSIVAVTDDSGKLTACLEIRDGSLVQAKLDCNRRVSTNADVNQAILNWCKEVGLKISTSDVYEPRPEDRDLAKAG